MQSRIVMGCGCFRSCSGGRVGRRTWGLQATRLPLQEEIVGDIPAGQGNIAGDTPAATGAISSAIDHNELALVWPIFGIRNESCSHGIVSHIYPFLGVTFVAPQDVVEEAGLPKMIPGLQRNRYCSFQSSDPLSQADVRIDSDEEVNVIRHDHVPSDCGVEFVEGSIGISLKGIVNSGQRMDAFPIARRERHEVERCVGNHAVKARGAAFDHDELYGGRAVRSNSHLLVDV